MHGCVMMMMIMMMMMIILCGCCLHIVQRICEMGAGKLGRSKVGLYR